MLILAFHSLNGLLVRVRTSIREKYNKIVILLHLAYARLGRLNEIIDDVTADEKMAMEIDDRKSSNERAKDSIVHRALGMTQEVWRARSKEVETAIEQFLYP